MVRLELVAPGLQTQCSSHGWINIRGAESIFKGHIEKFMVCLCRVSVGSVGDAWQAVL